MSKEKEFKYQVEKNLGGENINMAFKGNEAKFNYKNELNRTQISMLLGMGLLSIKRSGAGLHLKFEIK